MILDLANPEAVLKSLDAGDIQASADENLDLPPRSCVLGDPLDKDSRIEHCSMEGSQAHLIVLDMSHIR